MSIFDQLREEFPHDAVSWRAQTVRKDGASALALAYIDARDVMNRLDDVLGPGGWQDRYEVHGAKTICYLSIKVDGEWITKADGAGDTDVEAEKGSISDAFKRSAVKWGIGRYLYDLKAPWVPCESYETTRNGKTVFVWSKWKVDPWNMVKNSSSAPTTGRNAPAAVSRTSSAGASSISKDEMIAKLAMFDLMSDMVAWANSDPIHSSYSRLSDSDKAAVDAAYRKAEARIEAGPGAEAA